MAIKDPVKKSASRYRRHKRWTDRNPSKMKEYQRAFSSRRLVYLNDIKSGPCVDCGHEFPPYIMQFDHVRGEPVRQNGRRLSMSCLSNKDLELELAKCDVVCANCHVARTYFRRVDGRE